MTDHSPTTDTNPGLSTSFGRALLPTPADRAWADRVRAAESTTGRSEAFTAVDSLTSRLAVAALTAKKPGVQVHRVKKEERLDILGLTPAEEDLLGERYGLTVQQGRGAWYLPATVKLGTGYTNLGVYRAAAPGLMINAVRDDTVVVAATDTGAELYLWSVIIPFLTDLLGMVEFGAPAGKPVSDPVRLGAWEQAVSMLNLLGVDVGGGLQKVSPGSSGPALSRTAKVQARQELVDMIASQVTPVVAARWRVYGARSLAAAFYKKAKAATPMSTAVITKALQPTFTGIFAGSWADLLHYFGETMNPAEQVQTALPEPRLYTGSEDRVADVAAQLGLPAGEVAAMLAAYTGAHSSEVGSRSPVTERSAVMKRWWSEFDHVHAAQKPGNRPLWGLVDEEIYSVDNPRAPTPYDYRTLLSAGVVADVDRLWDGFTLKRWPERTVSEFQPHRLMAEAFGPALTLWHAVALTCWYVCEGPMSRVQLPELADRYRDQCRELEAAGFPVDPQLFVDLMQAERRLGPERPYRIRTSESRSESGVTLISTVDDGARKRDGFEMLRDIVTGHRRRWAERYLADYLKARWNAELRGVATEYNRRHAATGKTVTYKQFARFASGAANHWFNGDLAAVYSAVGEVAPIVPERHDLLLGQPADFLKAVSARLQLIVSKGPDDWERDRLAARALNYLQLQEALGRPPTQREFGAARYRWDIFGPDLDESWQRYSDAIEAARLDRRTPPTPSAVPAGTTTVPTLTANAALKTAPAADLGHPGSTTRSDPAAVSWTPPSRRGEGVPGTAQSDFGPVAPPDRSSSGRGRLLDRFRGRKKDRHR